MTIHAIIIANQFEPHNRQVIELPPGITMASAVQLAGMDDGSPVIVGIDNGSIIEWWLRESWDQAIPPGSTVHLRRLVAGGGGGGIGGGGNAQSKSQGISVAMIVAGIVVLATTGWTGAGAAAGFGLIVGGVAGLAGSLLIKSPSLPSNLSSSASAASSPTYSFSDTGNRRRIGEPIPVVYGRHRLAPDLIAEPWTEYVNNEQYLHLVLCLGHGSFAFDPATDIRLADADLASFAGTGGIDVVGVAGSADPDALVSVQVVNPGETLTAFHDRITVSSVVSDIDLPVGMADFAGPFVANPAGTTVEDISVDLVFPRGLMNNGSTDSASIEIQAQPIDDSGAPTSEWFALATETFSDATVNPKRITKTYVMPTASPRWQIQIKRTNASGGSSTNRVNDLHWGGLRARLSDVGDYPASDDFPVTLIALRLRASSGLNNQSASRVGVLATRKLPIWNGSTWSSPTATRNPVWALADALRNADYGGALPDSRIDLASLLTLAQGCDTRGDCCDGVLDGTIVLWEAATRICRTFRAVPVQVGGVITATRDQVRPVRSMLFTPATIKSGSLSISYQWRQSADALGVSLAFIDPGTWQPAHAVVDHLGGAPEDPANVDLWGVTKAGQAFFEALYLARQQQYQRKTVQLATECDGFVPQIGDRIGVSHDLPSWGQSATLEAISGNRLTLSEPLTWIGGTHYVGLRKPDGSMAGPFVATEVSGQPNQLDFTGTLGFTPVVDPSIRERTTVAFGPASTWVQDLVITEISPGDEYSVELACVPYDPRVFDDRRCVMMSSSATPYDATSIPDPAGYQSATTNLMPDGSQPWRMN